MIERHARFSLKDHQREAGTLFRERYRAAIEETPGFDRVVCLQSREVPSEKLMVLDFEDTAATVAWRQSDPHEEGKTLAYVNSREGRTARPRHFGR